MRIIGIVPARMGSSRFPGKPLADINGVPMIGHVCLRSRMSELLDDVFVATCDAEIADYAASIGIRAIMTSAEHERCTDRIAEALLEIERQDGQTADIVVNIQGDEPMLRPEMIDESVRPMKDDPSLVCVNLMAPLKTIEEHEDPNEVKVVVDREGFALYFSREPIPSRKKGATDVPMRKQVCIMPFRRDFLLRFRELEPTPLEVAESVDMLRALEHGYEVKMVLTDCDTYSVDTPEDLSRVARLMESDDLAPSYA